jgi:putative ABC transport system permease protein
MNQALLVAKNLSRRKLRTFLMLVAILIAFLLYGALESFEHAFYASGNAAAADRLVTVNKINFTLSLPVSYAERIRQVRGVTHVAYQNWFGGYYQDPKEQLIMFAAEPQGYLEVYPDIVLKDAERKAWLNDRAGLLVGRNIATKYHFKVGDHIPLSSNIYSRSNGSHTWDFTVSGIFTDPNERAREGMVIMRHDYFDESVTFGRDTVSMFMFTTASPALNDSIIKTIDAGFANSPDETTTDTAAAFNRSFAAQLGNIALIISLVVATAFAAILLIVGNTQVMSVRERTREIGVLKTLGFSGGTILAQILAESLLLALVGALLGLGLATVALLGVDKLMSGFIGSMLMSWGVFLHGLGWAVVLGLVTGFIPAWSGLQLKIATALGRR